MRRQDDDRPLGDLAGLLDEDRALCLEIGHHMLVVHDLLAHVDGGAVHRKRLPDAVDRPLDPRAVTAWLGQQYPLLRGALGQRGSVRGPTVSCPHRKCPPNVAGRRPAKSTVPSARPPLSHAGGRTLTGCGTRVVGRSADPGPHRGQRHQPVGRAARPGLGRRSADRDQPPAGHEHRLLRAPRSGRRHLAARDGRPPTRRRPGRASWSRAAGSSSGPSPSSTSSAAPCNCTRSKSGRSVSARCSPGSNSSSNCWPPKDCSLPTANGGCRSCRTRSG